MVTRYGDTGLDHDMAHNAPTLEIYPSGRARRKTRPKSPDRNMTEDEDSDLGLAKKKVKRTFFNNVMLPTEEVNSDLAAMRAAAAAAPS